MIRIRKITSRRPGLYIRHRIVYKRRWVNWVGFAALPIGHHKQRWVGIAFEIPTQRPKRPIKHYQKHDTGGDRIKIYYDPATRKPLDYNQEGNDMKRVIDYFNQALHENGMQNGAIPFDPPAVRLAISRYRELLAMDKNNVRDQLISTFTDLNVGDMPEIQTMPLDELEAMTDHLQRAQAAGELDLETTQGIAELKRIVDQYTDQEGGGNE